MKKSRGFTLVEVTISVLLAAIIMGGVFSLLSSGMKTSSKGSAHLANVQSAGLLMAQIEDDAARTLDLSGLTPGVGDTTVQMTILEAVPGSMVPVKIVYDKAPGNIGVLRKLDRAGALEEHRYCREMMIQGLTFTRVDLPDQRIGLHVSLKTATPPNGTEEFLLERFIYCRNHASNSQLLGWKGP